MTVKHRKGEKISIKNICCNLVTVNLILHFLATMAKEKIHSDFPLSERRQLSTCLFIKGDFKNLILKENHHLIP